MRVLAVCQHYWPEPYRLPDICEALVARGHEVRVVTGVPNYPMGHIYPDYGWGRNKEQVHNGVRVSRTFTIGRRSGPIFRFINYYSFAISSSLYIIKMKEEYDVVYAHQTSPVMMSSAAMTYASKWRKKCLLYCMDLWPASLTMGGVKRGSPIYKIFESVSRKIYKKADRLLISSRGFAGYLEKELGIDGIKIGYLPQYADDIFIQNSEKESLPKSGLDLVFAGNIGAAQSVLTILQAAALLKGQADLRWHIIGDGSELDNCKRKADELDIRSITFHGRRPFEEMPAFYRMADAMLLTLTDDPLVSMTLPAKLQSYMAAGKPIIAAVNGEAAQVIEESGCGYCAQAGDAEGLANAVVRFITAEDRDSLGKKGRQYYHEQFGKDRFMDVLEGEMKRLISNDVKE